MQCGTWSAKNNKETSKKKNKPEEKPKRPLPHQTVGAFLR